MKEITFNFNDSDIKRIEKILLVLPEEEFLLDFLKFITVDDSYFTNYNEKIELAIRLSKNIFSKFDNDTVNEKYIKFSEKLFNLYSFLLCNFSVDNYHRNQAKLQPEWRRSTDYEKVKKWKIKHDELQVLISDIEDAYKELLTTSKEELLKTKKLMLSDYEISFNNETAKLKIGDFCSIDFPSYKNEHYLLRRMFSVKKNEAIDWEEAYEDIKGLKATTLKKNEIEKNKKSVKDTARAINARIQETAKTDCNLICWETNCLKRLY